MGSFYSLPDPPTLHTRAPSRATRESILLSIGRWLLTTATAVLIERASLDRHRSLRCLGNNRWRHSPRAPAESYDSHLEAFRPVQAGVFFGVEKLKGEPTFNNFGAEPTTPTKRASPSFMGPSPDGVEGFDFEGGIDEGDMSPTKKTKIKRGRAAPPRHKLPILFF